MEENELIEFVIDRIVKNGSAYNLKIEGNPSAKWFMLKDAYLAPFFSTATCDILFRFEANLHLSILFPEHVGIDFETESNICPLFLTKNTYIPGWRQVCPYLTKDVYEVYFENIAVLLQFVQNPILCGIHGCEQQVAHEKLLAENEYELPGDEKENFKI